MEGICLCQVYRIPGTNREIICIGLQYEKGELSKALFYESGYRFYKNIEDVKRHINEGRLVMHDPPYKK